jgi:hypothetical protein
MDGIFVLSIGQITFSSVSSDSEKTYEPPAKRSQMEKINIYKT